MEKCRKPRLDFSVELGDDLVDLDLLLVEAELLVELVGEGAGRFRLSLASSTSDILSWHRLIKGCSVRCCYNGIRDQLW
jgi:hypothetical protein